MSPQATNTLRDRCYEERLRVDRIIHLDSMAGEALDSDVEEFLTDDAADELGKLIGVEAEDLRSMRRDELEESLAWNDASGWLLQVATPVRSSYTADGSGFRYTWGICDTRVVSGRTYDEAIEKAFAWAKSLPTEESSTDD